MQDILGSVRRSLVFRPADHEDPPAGTLVHKINSRIRRSRIFNPKPSSAPPDELTIRWRKGELIGSGAFGRVYMGMNLDSGELLAVKQVLIAATKEKAQAHMKELEEEVKLLKNLSHPNIVRYLGTVREEDSLNILLEFVPGGSISSLLGKFGSFPEAVIRTYTKQLLLGLEYLHRNGIMHRDIKGANILVDNKGCIKLADFGASKQVEELATVTGAKSMKGTPYWMAPEVILQTGHSFSADIWSVGCTVIEMATGKPPWSQQYQEVAALFHIGTTKSHPPIPEHLSKEAKDFLLQCLQGVPSMRPAAAELLQHPFVTGGCVEYSVLSISTKETSENLLLSSSCLGNGHMASLPCPSVGSDLANIDCSTMNENKIGRYKLDKDGDNDMCQIDDKDEIMLGGVESCFVHGGLDKSYNPMSEPLEEWNYSIHENLDLEHRDSKADQPLDNSASCSAVLFGGENDLSYQSGPCLSEEDEELTESKIRAFLDEKALELKKLQTPLYEEFYNNSLNVVSSPSLVERSRDETTPNYLKLPPKSRSPSRGPIGTPTKSETVNTTSPGSSNRRISDVESANDLTSPDISSSRQEPCSPSVNFSQIQKKWKEELDQELERKREMLRQTSGGKTSSPIDRVLNRPRTRFASP
uniref:mitogen-activated protein kinase kinase kinase n=1 Tax=Kalanchoe fedtschenkoi TaxID=63787 RepID=A0A7N0UFJ5_KALFE